MTTIPAPPRPLAGPAAEPGTAPTIARHRTPGDVDVVAATGELDLHSASWLRDELREVAVRTRCRVVVDLAAVTFLDSTVLGMLLAAHKRARLGGGDLVLVADSRPVLRLLALTGLHRVFRVHATLQEALADCGAAGRA